MQLRIIIHDPIMSILGKKEGFFRVLGSFLILIGLILSILFNMFVIKYFHYLFFIIIVLPMFVKSVLLKLEHDIFVKHSPKFLLLIAVDVVVINTLIFLTGNTSIIIEFVIIESSEILLICCWHFSLSLYKSKKIVFALSGLISFFLKYTFWLILGDITVIIVFLIPTLLLGLLLIILSELIMKKKGILNYI